MSKPRKTINVDPHAYMKNTIMWPLDGAGQTGMLFQANISHYCDDCGGPLVLWIRL